MVKGELNVSEIRNLVRQHNKLQTIKNVDSKSRAVLIAEVKKLGYSINHDRKLIQRRKEKKATEKKRDQLKRGYPKIPENVKGKKK